MSRAFEQFAMFLPYKTVKFVLKNMKITVDIMEKVWYNVVTSVIGLFCRALKSAPRVLAVRQLIEREVHTAVRCGGAASKLKWEVPKTWLMK